MPIPPDREPGYFLKLMQEKQAAGGNVTFARRPDGNIIPVPTSDDAIDGKSELERVIFSAGKDPADALEILNR